MIRRVLIQILIRSYSDNVGFSSNNKHYMGKKADGVELGRCAPFRVQQPAR